MDGSREEIVLQNLGLVAFVARSLSDFGVTGLDIEDAMAFGVEGLIQAVDRFDEARGSTFASFAVTRIRGSILDAARRSDPLSRPVRKLTREADQAKSALAPKLGRWPTQIEVAADLGVSREKLDAALNYGSRRNISLDRLRTGDGDSNNASGEPSDPDENAEPGAALESKATAELLHAGIDSLPARDRELIRLRYKEERSLAEIAASLGISESRVSQLLRRIHLTLRSYLEGALPEAA